MTPPRPPGGLSPFLCSILFVCLINIHSYIKDHISCKCFFHLSLSPPPPSPEECNCLSNLNERMNHYQKSSKKRKNEALKTTQQKSNKYAKLLLEFAKMRKCKTCKKMFVMKFGPNFKPKFSRSQQLKDSHVALRFGVMQDRLRLFPRSQF